MAEAVARRGLLARWRAFSPFTRAFAVFTFLIALVLPLALFAATGLRVSLMHVRILLLWKFNRDSWFVMDLARDRLAQFPDQLIYHHITVNEHNMFMYPLTSLLVYEPLKLLPTLGFNSDFWLNVTALALFLVAVAIAAYLFVSYLARYTDLLKGGDATERLIVFALAAVLAIRYVPLVEAVDLGNIQSYLNGFFVIAFLFWLQGRKALAGICVGLICVIKPALAIFLIWAVLRREWRFTAWFVGTGAAFLIGAVIAYGIADNLDYMSALSVASQGAALFSNQTINGLLNRLMENGPITRQEAWGGAEWGKGELFYYAPYNLAVYIGTLISSAALMLGALFWRWREHKRAPNIDFLIAGLSFTMASPLAWSHHYGGTIVMFAIGFPLALAARGMGRGWVIALVAAFVLMGERFEVPDAWAHTPLNIFMSIGLFGALILLCCLYKLRHELARSPQAAADALAPLPGGLLAAARAA